MHGCDLLMRKKRILITGSFGYLGGRIAQRLSASSLYEICLGSRQNLSSPAWLPEAEVVVMDLSSPALKILEDVDVIIHLAALNEHASMANPHQALLVNSLGTLDLLNASIQAGVKRFIYFSTAHVYGSPLRGHIHERTLPKPIHPYAITHRLAEDFILAAQQKNDLTGIVVRLSNAVGAPSHLGVDRWTLLVNDLCQQVIRTGQMVLTSYGLQQRDFITLEDVTDAVLHLVQLDSALCDDGLFNLGGDCSLSIWDMAQRVAARCEHQLGFLPLILRPEKDPQDVILETDLVYDSSKLQRTGLQLKRRMDQAIDETLALLSVEGLVI